MNRRILVFTVDLIPLPGLPVYGGGLRAWGLGQALAAAGHEVLYSVPRELIAGRKDIPKSIVELAFRTADLHEIIAAAQPDILLFEQWGLLEFLPDEGLPTIVDIHGSLILENAFRGQLNWSVNAEAKIKALRKADLVTVPGRRQADYIKPWLLLAGENPRSLPVAIVPVSMPPEMPARGDAEARATRKSSRKEAHAGRSPKSSPVDPVFVHGGNLWPWIDPFPALEVVAETLERRGQGRLLLFTGHPKRASVLPQEPPAVADPAPRLARVRAHARVEEPGFVPRDELLRQYLSAQVAVDVYRENAERDLAITTRTIEYLWAGLPVLHADYAELSPILAKADAGWIVHPDDRAGIARIVESVLDDPSIAHEKGANARRLVAEKFTWDKTIGPVDAFCRDPIRRGKGRPIFAQLQREFDGLRREWDGQKEHFQSTIGKLSTELTHLGQRCESLRQNSDTHADDVRLKNEEVLRISQKMDAEVRWRDDEIRRAGHEKNEECRWRDEELRKKDEELRATHLERARDIRELNDQIVQRDRRLNDLTADIERARNAAAKHEARAASLDAQIAQLTLQSQLESDRFESDRVAFEQARAATEAATGALTAERDDARTDSAHLHATLARLQTEFEGERQAFAGLTAARDRELTDLRAEVEGLRSSTVAQEQGIRDRDERIRWLEGVLFSLKNRLPFKCYKFMAFWTRRIAIQIPTLLFLYVLNFVSNLYMHWWTQRHRQQVFPGM